MTKGNWKQSRQELLRALKLRLKFGRWLTVGQAARIIK
jgi:hypothetical protein